MSWKKLLALMVVALLALSPVGLAEGEAAEAVVPEGRIQVDYWNLLGGADGEVLVSIIDEFNKSQNEIFVVNMTQDWGQYYTKLRTAVLGGTSPDLAISHADSVKGMYEAGMLLPIQTEMERLGVEFNFDKIISPAKANVQFDGVYYAVPQDILTQVYYYNIDLLKPLGLLDENDQPNYLGSLEDFTAAVEKMNEANPNYFAHIAGQSGHPVAATWFGFYMQLGGDPQFLSDDSTSVEWDEAKALEAFELTKQYYDLTPPKMSEGYEIFCSGEGYGMIEGTWSVNNIITRAEATGFNLGIVSFPQFIDKTKPCHAVYSHSLILPVSNTRDDEKSRAALTFVKYFLENNEKWAGAGHMPAYADAYETEFFKSLPKRDGYANSMDELLRPFPAIAAADMYTCPELNDPLAALVLGEIDAQECFETVRDNLNDTLSR